MDARSADDQGRFPLYGGRACLNLVATLGRRHDDPVERMPDSQSLADWLVVAGLLPSPPEGEVTTRQLAQCRSLREAINRLVRAAITGAEFDDSDVELVNGWAARPPLAPQLRGRLRTSSWDGNPVDAAMASIARDAVEVLTGPPTDRLKECEHPDCSLLFLDDSQSGRRRWCSMDRCGNLHKVAHYRRRTRQ